MDQLFRGTEDSSRSSTTRASSVRGRNNRRNIDLTEVDRNPDDAYGADRPDADRSTGAGRTFYSIGNVNAWNRYQDNLRALNRHQNTFGTQGVDRQGNIVYTYSNQQQLNTARSLRAQVFDYQEDTQACDGGDRSACSRVGRFMGRNSRRPPPQYKGGGSYNPELSSEPTMEAEVAPSGDVAPAPPEAPETIEDREARCNANGGEWHSDVGGSCIYVAPSIPAEGSGSGEHNPHPDNIERPSGGGGSHDQQGQGSIHQDGRDGGVSGGEHTVHDLPSGGMTPKNFKRKNLNPNRERLNTILALESLRQPLQEEQDGRFLF